MRFGNERITIHKKVMIRISYLHHVYKDKQFGSFFLSIDNIDNILTVSTFR